MGGIEFIVYDVDSVCSRSYRIPCSHLFPNVILLLILYSFS